MEDTVLQKTTELVRSLMNDFNTERVLNEEEIGILRDLLTNYEHISVFYDELSKTNNMLVDDNLRLTGAVNKLCAILQDIEKDSCCYCPFNEEFCVDPIERGHGYCRKDKWKEWALKDEN